MSEPNEPFNFENEDDDEIWDEYRWERFKQQSDMRSEKYRQLLEKYMDHPDRDKIIAKEMGWDDLLEDLEAYERGEIPDYEEDIDDIMDEDIDEGDEWKKTTGYESDDSDSVKNLPVYQKAYQYSLDAHKLVKKIGEHRREKVISDFIGAAIIPAAKIAGGYAMGFEMQFLGGNIANCKRGLAAANRTLNALDIMLEEGIIDQNVYDDYYNRGKEVRDDLAAYIEDLRERFRRGSE